MTLNLLRGLAANLLLVGLAALAALAVGLDRWDFLLPHP